MSVSTAPSVIAQSPAHQTNNEGWSSKLGFILAAVGSAVGLGNVWKFPYIVGEHGGGAFVLVYLACIALIGAPVLMAEILVGRRGGGSAVQAFRSLASSENVSGNWAIIGWIGILCAFLILSFYSVVAGWSLSYLWFALTGSLQGVSSDNAKLGQEMSQIFAGLLANPWALIVGHTLVMVATMLIVARGIRRGLEAAVRWMVPGLFMILIALVVYAASTTGAFGRAATFMFRPNFSALDGEAVLVALGHAFFTLSVGMTAMMTYGAYLKKDISIGSSATAIAGLDTVVALLAGLAIFPIVFAAGLEPGAGPGLVFVTLPIAFAQIPGGAIIAALFFLFLLVAALSSTISVLEPVVEYFAGRPGWTRLKATGVSGFMIWVLGIGSALAFNVGAEFTLFGKNVFDLLDYVTANLLLPLGGLLIAIYAGFVLPSRATAEELAASGIGFRVWLFLTRYVAPVGIASVLVLNLR
ncbi:MAG: sodium-dependent transporter [Pseudomonadota bacterium]